ncbi:hypothetical protein BKI52_15860 [marine bacterium AO1-C]|nr:hypothetical protein BKI52_15860 [marine bacterium AO1-C]
MHYYTHLIKADTHGNFLQEQRQDPITKELIRSNDMVVLCAGCKSAFLESTWKGYLKGNHCDQTSTLEMLNGVKGYWVSEEVENASPPKTKNESKGILKINKTKKQLPKPSSQVQSTAKTAPKPAYDTPRASRKYLLLIAVTLIVALVLFKKNLIDSFISQATTTETPGLPHKQLKNIAREVMQICEKKTLNYFPDKQVLESYYEEFITMKENGQRKSRRAMEFIEQRIFGYLQQVTWDYHVIDEESWHVQPIGQGYQLSFEFDYTARRKNDVVVKARGQRTYKLNKDLKIYDREDQVIKANVWQAIKVKNITASSSQGGHLPYQVNDQNLHTWWSPQTSQGYEWLRVDFYKPVYIEALTILGGQHASSHNPTTYFGNNRIEEALLTYSNGTTASIHLKDVDNVQVRFLPTMLTSYIVLKVQKVYDGKQGRKLSIAHLKFLKKIK